MAATITAFLFFNKFKERLGKADVDLSSSKIQCWLHKSATNVATDAQLSTMASITGTALNGGDNFGAPIVNQQWTAASAAPGSIFKFVSDNIVITAQGGTMTVKYAVFGYSAGAGTIYPVGYIQLTNSDTEVTDGNTVTITPDATDGWFKMD